MAVRTSGEALNHIVNGTIVSDGLCIGSIQVPPNGQPIIMVCDYSTTGGYPKIATVISADNPLVAQATPGTVIHFQSVDMAQAHEIYMEQYQKMCALERQMRALSEKEIRGEKMDKVFSISELQTLVKIVSANRIDELRYVQEGVELNIKNSKAASSAGQAEKANESPVVVAEPAPSPVSVTVVNHESAVTNAVPASMKFIRSPLVGTFYAASAPGEVPFVTVGSHVQMGDTIGIIELMKVMNSIPSDQAGVIAEILVTDGTPVEYGQPLMRLE